MGLRLAFLISSQVMVVLGAQVGGIPTLSPAEFLIKPSAGTLPQIGHIRISGAGPGRPSVFKAP